VLQTTAGKMIFGRLWEEADNGGTTERLNGTTTTRRPVRDIRPAPTRIVDEG